MTVESAGVKADTIASSPTTYYGATVTGYNDYTNSGAGIGWKILYAGSDFSSDGSSHIYLIADDYIHKDYCPSSANYSISGSSYKLNMSNVYLDYTGASSISEYLQPLNSSFFASSSTKNSTYTNIRAVAYMMDTNVWKVYKGSKADYAIGGPTIEMIFKSYNQRYDTNYQASVQSSSYGYLIYSPKMGWGTYMSEISDYLNKELGLYRLDMGKASSTWFASPSHEDVEGLMGVNYMGMVGSGYYNDSNIGFRPLVCLSSGVKLQDNGNGTFAIK